jgi:transitional endoplasmic reticulum ATPase
VRGESGLQADVRMGTQLLSLLDGLVNMEEVVVIGTTNRINSIDLALRRPGRFDKEIILPPMDDKGRLEVLHIHTRRVPLDDAASAFMPELAQRTHGYVGADLRELVREAGFTALRRVYGAGFAGLPTEPSGTAPLVTKADLLAALSRTAPSALRETLLQVADAHWSDIGGLKEEIRALRDAVEMPLRHSQAFAALRMKPSNGILLYGPSGTGKTMLAKAVANECGANFLPVSGPEIFSKWLGQSEAALRNLFQTARRVAPAVIFFDQLDALGARREDGAAHEIRPRIIGQLLAEMEGIQSASHVVVLAATNRKDLLDDALLEGGRFGQQIYVGLPDLAARRGILQLLLRDVPLAAGDDVSTLSEKVAARAGLVSGAALAALCEGAKRIALRETRYDNSTRLGLKHLLRAIDELHLGDNSPRSKVARSKTRAKPRRK